MRSGLSDLVAGAWVKRCMAERGVAGMCAGMVSAVGIPAAGCAVERISGRR
jgi:hypothetical protein